MNATLLAVLLSWPAAARADGPSAMDQLFAAQGSMAGAVGGSPESAAASSRFAFSEQSRAGAVRLGGRGAVSFSAAPPAPLSPAPRYEARATPLKAVYQAGDKKEEDKKPGWDYGGTVMAAGFGVAGAVIGFMLGGPIGAAAGFLAAFFIGALIWKMGQG